MNEMPPKMRLLIRPIQIPKAKFEICNLKFEISNLKLGSNHARLPHTSMKFRQSALLSRTVASSLPILKASSPLP
jgi:hypothetical protein